MRVTAWLAALTALVLTVLLVPEPQQGAAKKKRQKRPNIVVVMTDDQTVESLRVMPKVNELLTKQGTTFKNNVATFPLCCPSRATFLTGQYAHSHGVLGNRPPGGGYSKLAHSRTLPVWLQRSGYHTAHIGKYLNGYGRTSPDSEVPPGYSEWYGSLDDPDAFEGGTYTMYGYTLNENGRIVHYGTTPDDEDPAIYQTDVYSRNAEDFIRRRAPKRKPFFLSVAPLAPHGEAGRSIADGDQDPRPAPRHENVFAAEPLPRPPSFNEQNVSDKPQEIRSLPTLGPTDVANIRLRYRSRLGSLLAVDEMVANIVDALKDKGELKRTVILFTSDNGFFHGEYRIKNGKVRHYEPSSKVPLIVRGPGVPHGKKRSQLAANVDLAPTILDYANAKADRKLEGRSLVPLIRDKRFEPGRGIVIEAFLPADPEEPENPNARYSSVRTDRYIYVEHSTGEQELYDLFGDPFELVSRHADPAYTAVEAQLDRLLARLANCRARVCRSRPKVKLKLGYRTEPAARGRCVASGVRAKVGGAEGGVAVGARFFAGKRKAGGDFKRPLRRKIGRKRLSGRRPNRIRAIVMMLDGRDVTLKRTVPQRCG